MPSRTLTRMFCGLLAAGAFAGCGGGDSSPAPEAASAGGAAPPQSAATDSGDSAAIDVLPVSNQRTVAPAEEAGTPAAEPAAPAPAEGTPAWYLTEIRKLRMTPPPQTDQLDVVARHQIEQNDRIVELATQAIAQTYNDAEAQEFFNASVSELMEARLQNALQGGQDEIDLLYGDAESLQERDPESPAAMLASYAMVRFTHTNAQRYAAREPRWIEEFSRLARQFVMLGDQTQVFNNALPCSALKPLCYLCMIQTAQFE